MSLSTRQLAVYMDGTQAGILEQDATGRLDFTYDKNYLSNDPTPLSRSIPLASGRQKPAHIANFLAGLLPDNERTLAATALRFGVSPNNPFGILAHVGADTAGALQILPLGETPTDADEASGDIYWLSDNELATEVRTLRDPRAEQGAAARSGRWSLAGAQNKIALHHDGTRWGVPLDSTPTTHIIKSTISGFPNHDLNEYASMRSATKLGLPAATTSIVRFEEERALVSQRYDRIRDRVTSRWRRVHQEDLCQALGIHPSRKYQDDGGPSVRQIASVLNEIDEPSNRTFFDYLNYNVAIGATDAHAKNFALLMSGRAVRLAPLYDVASYLPYSRPVTQSAGLFETLPSSAMKIGRTQILSEITERDLIGVARILRVSEDTAVKQFRALRKDCPDVFLQVADAFDGSREEKQFLYELAAQVAELCRTQLENS